MEPANVNTILIVAVTLLFGSMQVLFMFIMRSMGDEIRTLRQRTHELFQLVARLDALVEKHFKDRVQ